MKKQYVKLHRERHRGSGLTPSLSPFLPPDPLFPLLTHPLFLSLGVSKEIREGFRAAAEPSSPLFLAVAATHARGIENPSSLSPLYRLTPRSHPLGHVSFLDSNLRRPGTATEAYISFPSLSFSSQTRTHSLFLPLFLSVVKKKVSRRARPYLVVMDGSKEAGRGYGGGYV